MIGVEVEASEFDFEIGFEFEAALSDKCLQCSANFATKEDFPEPAIPMTKIEVARETSGIPEVEESLRLEVEIVAVAICRRKSVM